PTPPGGRRGPPPHAGRPHRQGPSLERAGADMSTHAPLAPEPIAHAPAAPGGATGRMGSLGAIMASSTERAIPLSALAQGLGELRAAGPLDRLPLVTGIALD